MECYRCGRDIGDQIGLCDACKNSHVRRVVLADPELAARIRRRPLPRGAMIKGFVAGVVAVLFCHVYGVDPSFITPRRPPGVLAADDPSQVALVRAPWKVRDYTVTPLARYNIKGRVLFAERYLLGDAAEIVPLDLTLAWGKVSDQQVIDRISFTRERRGYSWSANEPPLDPYYINSHVANINLAPANAAIKEKLFAVRNADVVALEGFLIRLTRKDGWLWQSSMTRDDSGSSASELMWVENVEINPS